jgi:hypothetical protein
MAEFGVSAPWQTLVQVRQRIYEAILNNPGLLLSQRYPQNIACLQEVRHSSRQIGLATMSYCHQVQRILKVLGLSNASTLLPRGMMSNMAS